jgi:tetratricopeptide (TPR) repeat protein
MEPSLATILGVLKRLSDDFRELREGVFKAVQIAEIDPEMALTRCRKVLEFVVRDTYQRRCSEDPGTRPLENLLQRLVRDGCFPARLEAYATSIRMLGNVGTHRFGERITAADVYLCLTQFMPILEWYFEAERKIPLGSLVEDVTSAVPRVDPDLLLGRAHGLMAERNWGEAAKWFEEYARHRPDDWEANYSRGVAFANAREGARTDLHSLRAYNETIAFAPSGLAGDSRARLFAYRGAMLKRLGRLDEAEADLLLAMKHASHPYEVDDIRYNLAGVFAMRGEREQMMKMVRGLQRSPRYLGAIRAHLEDYFLSYKDDSEFLLAIGA